MTDPGAAGPGATERRRALQPLWNALDAHLAPHAAAGGALLAVSGGPDSRALLEAAARWPRRHELALEVASVDHGTREASFAEADAVVARARALGFSAHLLRLRRGLRGEAAWRDARYRALSSCARGAGLGAVVVAHHAGDAAEGLLLALTGEGGGAMVPARALFDVVVVRPFLTLRREDLRLALAACDAVDTFTEPDASSARARVRRDVLAPLEAAARFMGRGRLEARLAARARSLADDDEALAAAAAVVGLVGEDADGVVHVAAAPPAVFRRALRAALEAVWARDGSAGRGRTDPRDAAAGVEVALGLVAAGRAGHVDVSGAAIDVGPRGGARVAVRPPPTHDGRVDTRLSALRPVPMMGREDSE